MIEQQGHSLHIPVATPLADLLAHPSLPPALLAAAAGNPAATLAEVWAPSAQNALACVWLALDSELKLSDGSSLSYGSLLALGDAALRGAQVEALQVNLQPELHFAAHPSGLQLALARWPSGRARLAAGGFAAAPALALDGREPSGLQEALENALSPASAAQQAAAVDLLAALSR